MILKEALQGKRILLLSVQYFDYEVAIANQLRSFGAAVDFHDERPANSLFAKGIIRLKRSYYQKNIDRYYTLLLAKTQVLSYDYLFVIRGEVVPSFFLEAFKIHHPNTFLLYYTWDSFKNYPNFANILPFFDAAYTFDPQDAHHYQIKFRPLFFIEEYRQISRAENKHSKGNHRYTLLFLGTVHSDRYPISKKILHWCQTQNIATHSFFYCPSPLVYLYKTLFDPCFKKVEYRKLSFKPLRKETILRLYQQSEVILDIHHPDQKGLTMRTFEALGAGKKLITTNKEVTNYPFYNQHNVFVIDRVHPQIERHFLESPFSPMSQENLDDMSLSGWLRTLFLKETYPRS